MNHQSDDQLMTRQDVEKRFGIRKRYLEVADLKGTGPTRIIIGRLVRYRAKDIRAWIDAHSHGDGSEA